MGATLTLPFLDAMVPAATALAKTAAQPSLRLGAVFVPMGERPGYWTPSTTGSGFEFSPILKPIETFRDSLVIVSNLDRPPGGTHAVSTSTWLTGSAPKRTEAEDFYAGISLDQMAAGLIGKDTVFPSLEIATEDQAGYIGACDVGYSCAYMSTIAWKGPTTPLPMEINPRVVFERMFGRPGTAADRMARMKADQSILDSVRHDVASLERGLGPRDRTRLSEYLDHVREVEQRIQRAEKQATDELVVPEAPVGIPASFEEHVGVMFELMAVAYRGRRHARLHVHDEPRGEPAACSRISVSTNRGTTPRTMATRPRSSPRWSGSTRGTSSCSARFLDRLAKTPDGDGSLLDHSLILYGSGMSDSNTHSALDVPLLLAGKASGRMTGDRHLAAPKGTQLANAMLDVVQKFGAEVDRFGVSTGRFAL